MVLLLFSLGSLMMLCQMVTRPRAFKNGCTHVYHLGRHGRKAGTSLSCGNMLFPWGYLGFSYGGRTLVGGVQGMRQKLQISLELSLESYTVSLLPQSTGKKNKSQAQPTFQGKERDSTSPQEHGNNLWPTTWPTVSGP